MAPTICSGKKRQTRTIATTNIRRHEQGSNHQLNQALSNIVNYVAKGSINPRVSASLRIQTHSQTGRGINTTVNYHNTNSEDSLNYNQSLQTSATSAASNRRHQQFSFISDNAVTSSTHLDTENSFDLRLTNEAFTNDLTTAYGSNAINPTSSTSQSPSSLSESSSSSSSSKETTSSSTSPCEQRRFQRYSSVMQTNNFTCRRESSSNNDVMDLYEDANDKVSAWNKETNQMHSSNIRKHYYACNDFDSADEYDVDELEETRELDSDMSGSGGSDTDIDTYETDSMTSLDTEKSAKLKRGNHPLLRDKLLAKQRTNDNTKSLTNIGNTDGLLSIAIKTIKLVKRNQLLQQRLTQLQLETSEFIQSVLANPENRHFRENIKQKVQEVDNV